MRRRLRRGDASRTHRARVLPLALAGLAALGHRGAFAADGESSDGAGVALPLERPLVRILAPGRARATRRRDAVPAARPRTRARPARLVEDALAAAGPARRRAGATCRSTPTPSGREARGLAAGRRPGRSSRARTASPWPPAFERRLLLARRRMEHGRRGRPSTDFAVASASSRTVVYKGLVAGGRLADFYPDLRAPDCRCQPRRLPPALRDEHARRPGRSRSRSGSSPTTARSTRSAAIASELRGRRGAPGRRARRPARARSGRCSRRAAPTRSRSTRRSTCCVASGWRLDAALLLAIPEAPGCARERARPSSRRSAANAPACSRHGTARRRLSSATASASARCSTATACARWR